MDAINAESLLASSMREVLEIMFVTEISGRAEARPERPSMCAGLRFNGSPSGRFVLEVTESGARQLAANFLGLQPTLVTKSQAGEVICELANMVCGSALSRIESETLFDLLQPELMDQSTSVRPEEIITSFELGEGFLIARMAFEG